MRQRSPTAEATCFFTTAVAAEFPDVRLRTSACAGLATSMATASRAA